ncbi:MAG: hypothetical protein WD342_06930 [Verrucomicrobiales bacterium]
MKKTIQSTIAIAVALAYGLFGTACTKEDGHDHEEHEHHDEDHGDDDHPHGDDDPAHADGDHEHDDHDHDHDEPGPNGGRVLYQVEPHLEFLVTEDRKVQIAQVNENHEAEPIGEQVVTIIGGDRSNPTRMKLEKQGDVLVSDVAFPAGNDFPVVVQIRPSPDAKAETVRFNLEIE